MRPTKAHAPATTFTWALVALVALSGTACGDDDARSDTTSDTTPDTTSEATPDTTSDTTPDTTSDTTGETGDDASTTSDLGDTSSPDTSDITGDTGEPAAVVIVSPAGGATLTGDVNVSATATHPSGGVDGVTFRWLDLGVSACADTTARASGATFSCTLAADDVPPGAHVLVAVAQASGLVFASAEVGITTTGGTLASGSARIAARVVPPAGADADDYDAGSYFDADTVASDGAVQVITRAPGVTLVLATPLAGADADTNALLAFAAHVPGGPIGAAELEVSPRSTALALLVMHPRFASLDPSFVQRLTDAAVHLPAVQALADYIDDHWAGDADPLSDTSFLTAYDAAYDALRAALPAAPEVLPGGGPLGSLGEVRWHALDYFNQLELDVDGAGVVTVDSRLGMPLTSVLRLAKVDLDALHRVSWLTPNEPIELASAAFVDNLENYRHCTPGKAFYPTFEEVPNSEQLGVADDHSFYGYTDVLGLALDAATSTTLALLGYDDDDPQPNELALDDPDEPALYVLRAYNGRTDTGPECGELEHLAAVQSPHHRKALILNMTLAAMELLSLLVDVGDYATACADEAVTAAEALVPADGFASGDQFGAFNAMAAMADAADDCVAIVAQGLIEDGLGGAGVKGLKKFSKSLRVLETIQVTDRIPQVYEEGLDRVALGGSVGAIIDRLTALFGGFGLTPFSGQMSPMETFLIRVGDPFTPVVVDLVARGAPTPIESAVQNQVLIANGESLTLLGAGFRAAPATPGRMPVRFIDAAGRRRVVRGVVESHERLVVSIPSGIAGVVAVDLLGPGTGLALGAVLVIEPQVTELRPAAAFVPTIDFGLNWEPTLHIVGQGFDDDLVHVVLDTGSGPNELPIDRTRSTDQLLVVATTETTPTGVWPIHLDTRITSNALRAAHPDGIVDSETTLRVLPAPKVTAQVPEAIGGGEIFRLGGFNFGAQRDAIRLQLIDDAGKATTTLPIMQLRDLGGSGDVQAGEVQTSELTAKLIESFPPNPEPTLRARLTTPSGSVELDLAIGEEDWPTHARTVTVYDQSGIGEAVAFVRGVTQPSGTFRKVRTPVDPEEPDGAYTCEFEPDMDVWPYAGTEQSPPTAIGVSAPPARLGDTDDCPATCAYDSPFSFNQLNGLPTSPCPANWQGLTAGDIRDTLAFSEAMGHLPPTTIEGVNWLTVNGDVATGGGLTLRGITGKRSHLQVNLSIDDIVTPSPDVPVLTLDDIDGATVFVQLAGGDPAACGVGVRIRASRNVRVFGSVSGCKIGFDVDGSQNVTLGTSSLGYGDGGTGVHIHGGSLLVEAGVLELRAHGAAGPGSSPVLHPGARGLLVEDDAESLFLSFVAVNSNEVGVDIRAARDVVIQGIIGAPPPTGGTAAAGWGNTIGVDLVGPVDDVVIGGDPLFGVPIFLPSGTRLRDQITVIANNGRADPNGVGVRVGAAAGVVVQGAYIGVAPPFTIAGNGTGVLVGPLAADVTITGCHLGDDTIASVDADGAVDGLVIQDTLVAGRPRASWVATQPFPTVDPAFTGSACADGAPAEPFAPEALPAFHASTSTSGIRLRDGTSGVLLSGVRLLGAPLVMDDVDTVEAKDLVVWGAPEHGIHIAGSEAVVVARADVWGHGDAGVLIEGSPDVALDGCFAANGTAGVEVTGTPPEPLGHALGRAPEPPPVSLPGEPAGTRWRHLAPRLAGGAGGPGAMWLVANTEHGLHIHDGDVPLELAGVVAIDNGDDGVHIAAYDAEVHLLGSALGLRVNAGLDVAAGNGGAGLAIIDTDARVTVGGGKAGNVVSGNTGDGIFVQSSSAVRLLGVFVGTDDAGLVAIPNGGDGIAAEASDALLVDVSLVSGNAGHGIRIDAADVTLAARIDSTAIGTDRTGTVAVPNGEDGVAIHDCDVPFGGPFVHGALVSGNDGWGVSITDCDGVARIADSGIGSANPAFGAPPGAFAALPNGAGGVVISASRTVSIRGSELGAGAGRDAVRVDAARGANVEGNTIRGPHAAGVRLMSGAEDARIAHNVIRDGAIGVLVDNGARKNRITRNSIHDHLGEGITLAAGGNDDLPAPTVRSRVFDTARAAWVFQGTTDPSVPDGALVEVFADGADEGRIVLGQAPVMRGAWLLGGVLEPPPATLAPATKLADLELHATVTDLIGNTSELGPYIPLPDPSGAPCGPVDGPPLDAPDLGVIITSRGDDWAATALGSGADVLLTDLPAGGGEADVCGDKVVFSGGGLGARDLYLRDFTAAMTTPLAAGAGDDVEPAFAPDCSAVVFASDRSGSWDLWRVATSGGAPTALTSGADVDRAPSVAADGRVAFMRTPAGASQADLWLSDGAPGASVTALIASDADERDPSWHPGDDRIAFVRCAADRCGLVVVDLAAGLATPLGSAVCDDRRPEWVVGADGIDRLVFERAAPGEPASSQVLLANETGHVLWRVSGPEPSDHAPACCFEGAP